MEEVSVDLRNRVQTSIQFTLTETESKMKITLPVSRFKQILKSLGGVCNPRAVEPSYRYIGVQAMKDGSVSFVACNIDMMGRSDFKDHPEIQIEGLDDEVASGTMMLDSQLFSQLIGTLDSSAQLELTKDSERKSIRVKSGAHESEQQFNFDVRFEDLHKISDFGGELTADGWTTVDLHLSPLMKQVEFCMPRDFQTDDHWLSAIRISLQKAESDDKSQLPGTWIQMQATDMYRFAHLRFRHDLELPPAELLIDQSIVAQIDRLDFTSFAFRSGYFCFFGGDSGIVLYTRMLGGPNKFPDLNPVFDEFRQGKTPQILQVERDRMIPVLRRQCLFADQSDAMLYSQLSINTPRKTLAWGADNKISRGNDELNFSEVSSNITDQKLTVNPQALLSYVDRTDYSQLHMLLAKKGNKVFLAVCPNVKSEVAPVTDPTESLPGMEDSGEEKESEKKTTPKLLGTLANSEFLFVTGAKTIS